MGHSGAEGPFSMTMPLRKDPLVSDCGGPIFASIVRLHVSFALSRAKVVVFP